MSHFNKKSFIFYGVAIGSVVTLFSLVTAYGEAKLIVATPIRGNYQLQVSPQPDCPTPALLNLAVQQSGVYVTATLQPESITANPAPNPTAPNPTAPNPTAPNHTNPNHTASNHTVLENNVPQNGPEPGVFSGLWQRDQLQLKGRGLDGCTRSTDSGTAARREGVPLRIEAKLSQGQLIGNIASEAPDRKLTFVGQRESPPASAPDPSVPEASNPPHAK